MSECVKRLGYIFFFNRFFSFPFIFFPTFILIFVFTVGPYVNASTVTLAEHAGKTKHPSLSGAGVSIQLQAASQAAK